MIGGYVMQARRFWFLFLLVILWPSAESAVRVQVLGSDTSAMILRDGLGAETGPGVRSLPGISSAPATMARFTIESPSSVLFEMPDGQDFTLSLRSLGQPVVVNIEFEDSVKRTRVVRYLDLEFPAQARLDLAADGRVTLAVDTTGDGMFDRDVSPTVDVSGIAAADTDPPVVGHRRLTDGRYALVLTDAGIDITSPERLFYSLDGGDRYLPYLGPLAFDPGNTPVILAIGEDRVGNVSRITEIATAPPFCTRVAGERRTLQTLMAEALAQAVSAGEVPASSAVSLLAVGKAACLWHRDAAGNDDSCQACQGLYEPGIDPVRIAVLYDAAVAMPDRQAVSARFDAAASARRDRIPDLAFTAVDRSSFESGIVAGGAFFPLSDERYGDGGLALRLRHLQWALEGEYVDLGAGMDVGGPALGTVVDRMRVSGLPALEAFEAATRAEWQMLASRMMLRIVGSNRGIVADDPTRDSYENRILREQIESAGSALATANFGRLLVDACASTKGFAYITRSDYRTRACHGLACRTFEDYVASRLSSASGQCPGVIDAPALERLGSAAAIARGDPATLAGLLADECSVNEFLGGALLDVRELKAGTQAAYAAGLQGLTTNDPVEKARRQSAMAGVESANAGLLSETIQDLKLRLVNTGTSPLTGVVLRMFENGAFNGQERDLTIPADTALVIDGHAATSMPFHLRHPIAGSRVNEIVHVAFRVDPDGVYGTTTAGRKVAGLDYYVFDPANPVCPRPGPVIDPVAGP